MSAQRRSFMKLNVGVPAGLWNVPTLQRKSIMTINVLGMPVGRASWEIEDDNFIQKVNFGRNIKLRQ